MRLSLGDIPGHYRCRLANRADFPRNQNGTNDIELPRAGTVVEICDVNFGAGFETRSEVFHERLDTIMAEYSAVVGIDLPGLLCRLERPASRARSEQPYPASDHACMLLPTRIGPRDCISSYQKGCHFRVRCADLVLFRFCRANGRSSIPGDRWSCSEVVE